MSIDVEVVMSVDIEVASSVPASSTQLSSPDTCCLWDLDEEDLGKGPHFPNHSICDSDQSCLSQQHQSHQGLQHPMH
ncbi:hypothetical protein F2Q68_00038930 [Brassica cretica]|uniref:Uncharacterized protein n=1 Tax=Brassica cretica TaxID=69181 RepID=A0A8S9MHI9_BRACR|nr:hypothetical protein F2Q68_00038930 [Brassica cretica]